MVAAMKKCSSKKDAPEVIPDKKGHKPKPRCPVGHTSCTYYRKCDHCVSRIDKKREDFCQECNHSRNFHCELCEIEPMNPHCTFFDRRSYEATKH